jgi:antitoxin component YwqK of YwqJK toxin-antitoxin module|tara:strand:- start:89 stop:199 length:111 start_codon:yes stop_codon:yes gene_type:complete
MKKEAPKNGPYTEYYENGQKESEEYYKDGECISGDC